MCTQVVWCGQENRFSRTGKTWHRTVVRYGRDEETRREGSMLFVRTMARKIKRFSVTQETPFFKVHRSVFPQLSIERNLKQKNKLWHWAGRTVSLCVCACFMLYVCGTHMQLFPLYYINVGSQRMCMCVCVCERPL